MKYVSSTRCLLPGVAVPALGSSASGCQTYQGKYEVVKRWTNNSKQTEGEQDQPQQGASVPHGPPQGTHAAVEFTQVIYDTHAILMRPSRSLRLRLPTRAGLDLKSTMWRRP